MKLKVGLEASTLSGYTDSHYEYPKQFSPIHIPHHQSHFLPPIQHIHFLHFSSFFNSSLPQRSNHFNVVLTFSISHNECTPSTPMLLSIIGSENPYLVPSSSYSHPRSSTVNVVFVFNISPTAFAPSSSILFPFFVSFHFFAMIHATVFHVPLRYSVAKVEFSFSASLISCVP